LRIPTFWGQFLKLVVFFLAAFAFSIILIHSLVLGKLDFPVMGTRVGPKSWLVILILTFFIFFIFLLTDRKSSYNKWEILTCSLLTGFYALVLFIKPVYLYPNTYLFKTLAATFITFASVIGGVFLAT
jgi:hypothetical protein